MTIKITALPAIAAVTDDTAFEGADVGVSGNSTKVTGLQLMAFSASYAQVLTNKTIDAASNTLSLTVDSVDSITEIAAALKSGADGTLVTGTAGTSGNLIQWNGDGDAVDSGSSVADLQQTDEEIQDIVGAMFSGNTESGGSLTYQDGDGTIDLAVDVLSVAGKTGAVTLAAGDIASGTFADALVAESNVTQHEAAIDHDALTNFVANEHIDWTGASANFSTTGSVTVGTSLLPDANDGAVIGSTSLQWSDIFLASGAVLNFNNGQFRFEHGGAQGAFGVTSDSTVIFSVYSDVTSTARCFLGVSGGNSFVTAGDTGSGTRDLVLRAAVAGTSTNALTLDASIQVARWHWDIAPVTDDTETLGNTTYGWGDLYLGANGTVIFNNGPIILAGSGSPESSVTADVGSLYVRTDGGASTSLYVKESGTGNTGWAAK